LQILGENILEPKIEGKHMFIHVQLADDIDVVFSSDEGALLQQDLQHVLQ